MTPLPTGGEHLPREFDRYVLERKIGKGGMAWVFLGRQKPPAEKQVAIKVLFPHLAEDPEFLERFRREAKTGAMMQHPNIAQVFEYGEWDQCSFIAMEYVDGWDLRRWLVDHPTSLPVEVAMLVLRDMCLALEYAHAPGRDVIHRDIKPSNVMLTVDGRVKLMDFGLARTLSEDAHMTRTGQVMGTVHYMSPEQSRGERRDGEAGKRSDIFSAGVMCYELLGGELPFQGDDMSVVFEQLRVHVPERVDRLNPLVPAAVATAIEEMLEKDPERRCPDIGRIIAALDAALEEAELTRARTLLHDYVQDPKGVAETLRDRAIDRRQGAQNLHRPSRAWTAPRSAEKKPANRGIVIGILGITSLAAAVALGVLAWRHRPEQRDSHVVAPPETSIVRGAEPPADTSPPANSYRTRLLTRPGFAYVYVDGDERRLEPPVSVSLGPGAHRFRLVTRDHAGDCVLVHTIAERDSNVTLKLDFEQKRVLAAPR